MLLILFELLLNQDMKRDFFSLNCRDSVALVDESFVFNKLCRELKLQAR